MSSGVEWSHSSYGKHETPKRTINGALEHEDLLLTFERYLLVSCMFSVLAFSGKPSTQNNSEPQALFIGILCTGQNREYFILSGRNDLLNMMI
jgi:hypothetical protein